MEKPLKFGLIGKNISYSFSKKYYEEKFKAFGLKKYTYELFDMPDLSDIEELFLTANLRGLNVTIPYKEEIIPLLDSLSDEAKKIGAVNCILLENGDTKGFNTDVFGFEKTLEPHLTHEPGSALILGNGGASKAVQYVLENHQIPFKIITRNGKLNFENLNAELVQENKFIIQCTPVGTFPNIYDCLPFPFSAINDQQVVIDLIYNPPETKFLENAAKNGATIVNGLLMLQQQAEKNWEIWNFKKK